MRYLRLNEITRKQWDYSDGTILVRKETQGRSHEDGDSDVKMINPKDGQ